MILNDQEVTERMESPMNLHNRLRALTAQRNSKFSAIPSIPTAKDIIPDVDEKLAFGGLKSKASSVMLKAINELDARISETTKITDLARVAGEMNKIVTAETEEKDKDNRPQFILYAPQINQENNYETIYARE